MPHHTKPHRTTAQVFTAAGSLFCLDVYKQHLRPAASEAELVRVGRWFCLLLAVVTVLWLPVIDLLSEQATISLDLPRSP